MKNFEKEPIEISKDFECPLTLQPMFDPVVAKDGETYEREAIQKVIDQAKQEKKKLLSPIHHEEMGDELVPNRRMTSSIKEFLTQHPQCIEFFYFPKSSTTECVSALKNGQLEALRRSLEKDQRLLYKELDEKKTLLDLVCEIGTPEIIALVIVQLKKINKFSLSKEKQEELLLLCTKTKNLNGIKKFIAECQWTEADKKVFFIKQIAKGSVTLVELFLAGIIAVDTTLDENNNTALHVAVIHNQKAIIDLLMSLGANSKLINKRSQRPEQLAAELGNQELATYIPKQRQGIKLRPLKEQMEKLAKENADLKKERDDFRNKFEQLQIDFYKLKLQSDVKPAFFTSKSQKKQQHFDDLARSQHYFINAILAGESQKVMQLHQQGASLTKSVLVDETVKEIKGPSNDPGAWWHRLEVQGFGMNYTQKEIQVEYYPLTAAVYSGDKATLTYIEKALGEEAMQYWLLVDEDKVKQRFAEITPMIRPEDVTYQWLGEWYSKYANCAWKKTYEATVNVKRDTAWFWNPVEDWKAKAHALTQRGKRKLDPNLKISIAYGDADVDYFTPDLQLHDKCVADIINQMEIIKDYILKKITEVKSQQVWRPSGSK